MSPVFFGLPFSSLDHLSCAGLPRAPADPCSRESVLKVLKESRKREVDDEDRSFTTEQRSKRRYEAKGGVWRGHSTASSFSADVVKVALTWLARLQKSSLWMPVTVCVCLIILTLHGFRDVFICLLCATQDLFHSVS